VPVAGRGYRDGARNLEVMLESLSGGRRREIQEDGIVMEVKIFLFLFSAVVERGELGEVERQSNGSRILCCK